MGDLFDRRAQLQMGTIVVTGLRIQFKVEKHDTTVPSTATITVWNLARTTRDKIAASSQPVILAAGYGEDIDQLFNGDVPDYGISVSRNGPDWLTTFKVGDGLRCYQTDRVQIPLPANMRVQDALAEVLKQIKSADSTKAIASLQKMNIQSQFQQLLNHSVASGRVMDEANRIAHSVGMKVNIVDGQVEVTKLTEDSPNGAEPEDLVPFLSPETGLISAPEATGKKKFIKFKCLLRPWIRPMRRVKVSWSVRPKGLFVRAKRVTHTGDTRGQEWYTEVEGEAL
jgi:hypothetical protein